MKLPRLGKKAFLSCCIISPAFYIFNLISIANKLNIRKALNLQKQQLQRFKNFSVTLLPTHLPPDGAIYFLETHGRSSLSLRSLCSVEAASRHHPSRRIIIAMLSSTLVKSNVLQELIKTVKNFDFVHLDLPGWLGSTLLKSSKGRRLFSALSISRHKVTSIKVDLFDHVGFTIKIFLSLEG